MRRRAAAIVVALAAAGCGVAVETVVGEADGPGDGGPLIVIDAANGTPVLSEVGYTIHAEGVGTSEGMASVLACTRSVVELGAAHAGTLEILVDGEPIGSQQVGSGILGSEFLVVTVAIGEDGGPRLTSVRGVGAPPESGDEPMAGCES